MDASPASPAASDPADEVEENPSDIRASSPSTTSSGKQEDGVVDGVEDDVAGEGGSGATGAPGAGNRGPGPDTAKCVKCQKRYGKSTCSQLACIKCCDDEECEGHRATREEKKKQDEIMAGTSNVNKIAAKQRKFFVKPGSFPGEPSFHYLNESILIWDTKAYLANPKWREDTIRRSEKNKRAREVYQSSLPAVKKGNRKTRFNRIMNQLYEASIKSES